MSDSQIEEIKNRLNVLDVVGGYVKLSKTGVNYRGICPFHSEKGPSFFVSPTRQMWKCFGCGLGGDIFEFIKKIEGVEFGDALKILAAKAGVELKRENIKLKTERQRLYEICNWACSFFEKQLQGSAVGKEAKEYLLKRGITEDSIKKWRLGYSPDTWQGLSDFLVGKGYKREEIVSAGLAVKSEKGNNPYDRFRGRIIFPIFDLNSQVVGFGARVFRVANEKETAKYINTPQTLLYDKSNVLYGINNAKLSIRKKGQCVLTEGYTDAIMAHQAGFENTVAVSGTALTLRHLNTLKRYSDNLLLAFDMDLAGDTATKRGINLAQAQGFNLKIIDTYSGAKDPAEIILENPQNWENSVQSARSIMDYYFDSSFSSFDKNTPQGKKEIGRIILPAIKRLSNKIEQSHWIQKLSSELGVSDSAVIEELKSVNPVRNSPPTGPSGAPSAGGVSNGVKSDRKKLIEDKVVSLVLKDPENLNLIDDSQHGLFCDKTKSFIEALKKCAKNPVEGENSAVKDLKAVFGDIASGSDSDFKNFMATLSLRAEVEFQEDGADEIQLCLNQLKTLNAKEKLNEISGNIKKAEQAKDAERVNILIGEFNKIIKEI